MANQPAPSPQKKLTIQELREAYVRSRFAEPDAFGTEEIETWFAKERTADFPSDAWDTYLMRKSMCEAADGREITSLRRCADTSLIEPRHYTGGGSQRLALLLASLDPYKASVYIGSHDVIVVVFANAHSFDSFVIDWSDKRKTLSFHRLESPHVADIIMGTWRRRGGKARTAREFLCEVLGDDIRNVRKYAEAEFDEAVAVSEDGTEIVKAEWVVIFEEDPRAGGDAILYPAASWTGSKLPLIESYFEEETIGQNLPVEEFLHTQADGNPTLAQQVVMRLLEDGQDQADVETDDGAIVFFCHKKHVTVPLPPGGDRIM